MLVHSYLTGSYSLASLAKAYLQRLTALWRSSSFDLLWIEKECLPWLPYFVESSLLNGVTYVLDYDDAVFHTYDLHKSAAVRWFFGDRLDKLMAKASLVVVGNQYLAERAHAAGAPWVEVVPTAIDLMRYPTSRGVARNTPPDVQTIVWIGSPSTACYLEHLAFTLQQLAQRYPFVFRTIGASLNIPGVNVQRIPWTEVSEVESIAAGHIGVMPLSDSPWERGKCGYKLIQYMACSLPVVASPVGINRKLIQAGVTGFLANSHEDWISSLEQLLTQPQLGKRMGLAGRSEVEKNYCIQVTGPRLAELFIKVAEMN
jgi:glycosyltransferase involved in cell wall biosynthesis